MNDLAVIEANIEETGTDVAILRELTPMAVFSKPGGGDPIIEAIRQKYRPGEGDISTPKGQDEIRSRAFECAKDKKALERMGKELADDVRASLNPIIAERQRIVDEVQKIQDEVRKPLTDYEDAQKARREGHEAEIKKIESFLVFEGEPDSAAIMARIEQLDGLLDREWEEFSARADDTRVLIRSRLQLKHAIVLKAEQERAELERLRAEEAARQAEATRIAAEAETARRVAEAVAAEQAKAVEEAAKVERERLAAEQAATAERIRLENEARDAKAKAEKAELERMEAEVAAEVAAKLAADEAQRRADEQTRQAVEKERADAAAAADAAQKEAAAREADINHRRAINSAAARDLMEIALTADQAKAVIRAIIGGEITNVRITY